MQILGSYYVPLFIYSIILLHHYVSFFSMDNNLRDSKQPGQKQKCGSFYGHIIIFARSIKIYAAIKDG